MKPIFPKLRLLLSLALIPGAIHAADPASPAAMPPASIEAFVGEVLSQNPELRYYDAELTAARAQLKTAAQLPPPEVNGSLGRKRTTDLTGKASG